MTEEQLKNAAAPEDPGEAPAGEPVVEETAGKTAEELTERHDVVCQGSTNGRVTGRG